MDSEVDGRVDTHTVTHGASRGSGYDHGGWLPTTVASCMTNEPTDKGRHALCSCVTLRYVTAGTAAFWRTGKRPDNGDLRAERSADLSSHGLSSAVVRRYHPSVKRPNDVVHNTLFPTEIIKGLRLMSDE